MKKKKKRKAGRAQQLVPNSRMSVDEALCHNVVTSATVISIKEGDQVQRT